MHGFGCLKSADGSTYNGAYVKGKKEGYGVLEKVDGSKHAGYWKNDEPLEKGYNVDI